MNSDFRNAAIQIEKLQANRLKAALPPDMVDLETLYTKIRRQRPSTVVEFGAGYSTYTIGLALRDNGWGHLHSVESEYVWHKDLLHSFPESLPISLVYSPVIWSSYFEQEGWHYTHWPRVAPDILYMDGPELKSQQEITLTPIHYLMNRNRRSGFTMYVDGRIETVKYYEKHWGGKVTNWYQYPDGRGYDNYPLTHGVAERAWTGITFDDG